MSSTNAKLILPVIPKPPQGEASVLIAGEEFEGPFMSGGGDIDLHCGSCSRVLVKSIATGQIRDLVLKCPGCAAYNAIIEIPKIERIVSQLQAADLSKKSLPKFKKILSDGLESGCSAELVAEQIDAKVPELSWFKNYLVPSNAGETYAMLAFVLMLVTWYQTRPKKKGETAQTIINNYFMDSDPYKDVGPNSPCPCGSGKKFKHCHGKQ